MKVVVAVDSFKGSMTSMEAGTAVKSGILAAHPDAEVIVRPLADGGEGTTGALTEGLNGKQNQSDSYRAHGRACRSLTTAIWKIQTLQLWKWPLLRESQFQITLIP